MAERTGERITFVLSVANSGETLNVHVPKLNKNEVIVAASMALRLNIDLTGGHANNFLVRNVSRALVDKFAVKCSGTTPQETVGYDIFKFTRIFSFHCMSANMLLERIQTENFVRFARTPMTETTSVDGEKTLEAVFGNKQRIRLNHPILGDHGVFYPQALFNDIVFELTLSPASQVERLRRIKAGL